LYKSEAKWNYDWLRPYFKFYREEIRKLGRQWMGWRKWKQFIRQIDIKLFGLKEISFGILQDIILLEGGNQNV
jgi:hypothetical protein